MPGPAYVAYASAGGAVLSRGAVVGVVKRLVGDHFEPAAGVVVSAIGTGLVTTTDDKGIYGFVDLPEGLREFEANAPGCHRAILTCRLLPALGHPRANLALVPLDGAPPGATLIAGVVVDPRGAALPGGQVKAVDSLSNGGNGSNTTVTADGDGCYAIVLPATNPGPFTNGIAMLTAHGSTPGGLAVESTAVTPVVVDTAPTKAVVMGTAAVAGPRDPVWRADAPGGRRVLQATGLPVRRDELVLRFTGNGNQIELLPDEVDGVTATFSWPAGMGRVELLPLGVLPAGDLYGIGLR